MPRRDGTGPMGQGAMTGRGSGSCAGANIVRFIAGVGSVYGVGRGLGIGFRHGRKGTAGRNFSGQFPGRTEKEVLSQQKEFLQRSLEQINKRLQNTEGKEK